MKEIILGQYIKFVEFLGHILGPHYEIVLHDINDEDCSIIAIANGHVSEREVGAPLTDLGLQFIADNVWKTCNYKANYTGMSSSNKILLSSTFFIKDDNEKLIGILCVNVDTTAYKKMFDDFLKLTNMHSISTTYINPENSSALPEFFENFSQSLVDVINTVLSGFVGDDLTQVENLTQQEKMTIVDKLNQNGVFFLKGAVYEVAAQLKCSEASIYRYLSKINRNKQ
jgi:Uncharacterized protein conserved in bacteria